VDVTTPTSESSVTGPLHAGRRRRPTTEFTIVAVITVVAFGVYLWQLSVSESTSFYDSGVYFAATLHFVSGVVPYKNFTFVNPPGIMLLMSPLAFLSRLIGDHNGYVAARVLTSFVTALNAGLLAWLVRRKGRVAMVVAGFGLALLPVALLVSSAVKLDPYSMLFVLLGAQIILSQDHDLGTISTRRLLVGGVLFGFAGDIKLWAVFPFIALFICLLLRVRFRVLYAAGAAAIGFIVPSLPFFILAPHPFISQVFTVQLSQKYNPAVSQGTLWRLIDLTGFSQTSIAPTSREAIIAFGVLVLIVIVAFAWRQSHELVDLFLLLSAAITVCALLTAPVSNTYYAYFAAPFLLGVLGVSLSRIGATVRKRMKGLRDANAIPRSLQWTSIVVGVALLVALTFSTTTSYKNFAASQGISDADLSAIGNLIPSDSCVVYDFVFYGIVTNRVQSNQSDCPDVVDPYGMWQSWGDQLVAPSPVFVAEWQGYFEQAQYVVLHAPQTTFVPWNTELLAWFASNYYLVYSNDFIFIYAKTTNA
jgi:hypothetical protein